MSLRQTPGGNHRWRLDWGIGALPAAGRVCPDGVHWAEAATLPQGASSANGHSHSAQGAALKTGLIAPARTPLDGACYSFAVSWI